jgi:hypothetical protein
MAICYNLTGSHFLLSVFFFILLVNCNPFDPMRKKLICILVLGFELAACKEATNKKQATATTDSATQHIDTITALTKQSGPVITPLPFGPAGSTNKNFYKKDAWFYHRLIGEGYTIQHDHFTTFTPTYPLPTIEKYEHAVDEEGRDFCLGDSGRQISVDSLFSIKKYRIRFPDHNGFEVYYMTGQADVDTLFPQRYTTCEMNYRLYGYLIFYERATKTARLLSAFFNYYGESDHSRQFYIDSNYHIFLYSEMMTEGDGGEPDINGGPVQEVTINSKGKFTIKTLKFGRSLK